jgi:hypothetical protein
MAAPSLIEPMVRHHDDLGLCAIDVLENLPKGSVTPLEFLQVPFTVLAVPVSIVVRVKVSEGNERVVSKSISRAIAVPRV